MLVLDPETKRQLTRLAEMRGISAESLLREAVEQYLARELDCMENLTAGQRHPSGKPWPQKHPVGGIITPV